MKNKIIVISLVFFSFLLGLGLIVGEVISINCYEEDSLTKLKIKILYLTGNLNPFPSGVEPFSEQGAMIATQFNNFKSECLDKW